MGGAGGSGRVRKGDDLMTTKELWMRVYVDGLDRGWTPKQAAERASEAVSVMKDCCPPEGADIDMDSPPHEDLDERFTDEDLDARFSGL